MKTTYGKLSIGRRLVNWANQRPRKGWVTIKETHSLEGLDKHQEEQ